MRVPYSVRMNNAKNFGAGQPSPKQLERVEEQMDELFELRRQMSVEMGRVLDARRREAEANQ